MGACSASRPCTAHSGRSAAPAGCATAVSGSDEQALFANALGFRLAAERAVARDEAHGRCRPGGRTACRVGGALAYRCGCLSALAARHPTCWLPCPPPPVPQRWSASRRPVPPGPAPRRRPAQATPPGPASDAGADPPQPRRRLDRLDQEGLGRGASGVGAGPPAARRRGRHPRRAGSPPQRPNTRRRWGGRRGQGPVACSTPPWPFASSSFRRWPSAGPLSLRRLRPACRRWSPGRWSGRCSARRPPSGSVPPRRPFAC